MLLAPVDVAASCGAYFVSCPKTAAHVQTVTSAMINVTIARQSSHTLSIVHPHKSHATKNIIPTAFCISAPFRATC